MRCDSREKRDGEKKRQITIYCIIYYLMPFIFLDSPLIFYSPLSILLEIFFFILDQIFISFWSFFSHSLSPSRLHISCFCYSIYLHVIQMQFWLLVSRVFIRFNLLMLNMYEIQRKTDIFYTHEWNVMRTFFCLLCGSQMIQFVSHTFDHKFFVNRFRFVFSFFGGYGIQFKIVSFIK